MRAAALRFCELSQNRARPIRSDPIPVKSDQPGPPHGSRDDTVCRRRKEIVLLRNAPRRILSHVNSRDRISNRSVVMNNLTIEVWDATGNKKQLVELPSDAPVNRVIAVLVEKMNLPRYSPDGQLMSYKFHHKASGRQLLDDQTLASADIHNGDVLRLQPEITAGGRDLRETAVSRHRK